MRKDNWVHGLGDQKPSRLQFFGHKFLQCVIRRDETMDLGDGLRGIDFSAPSKSMAVNLIPEETVLELHCVVPRPTIGA